MSAGSDVKIGKFDILEGVKSVEGVERFSVH